MGKGIADKRIFFLINPKAGGGLAEKCWEKELPLLEGNIDFFYEYTEGPGSMGEQIRRAVCERGAEAVVIVGGDGSLYDAVNGIITENALFDPDIVFGVCPLGSGCDFARYIYGGKHLPLLDLIRNGEVRKIDVACCEHADQNGDRQRHFFINSFDMGAGADTCVSVNAGDGRIKRLTHNGKLAFLLSALKVLLSFQYTDTSIEADGRKYSGEYIIAGAGNGRFIGGGMLMFPQASLEDGMLDLLLVDRRSKLKLFQAFPLIYSGSHLSLSGVTYEKAAHIRIETGKPKHIELDGEVPGYTDVTLSVIPGILPLLLPV